MNHRPTTLVNVFLDGRERRKIGRLAAHGRRILFEYDPAFLATGLQISPFKLPTRSGVMVDNDLVFDGLFGVFNDSLPDGWGRLLLDRAVELLGIARQELTPLDRLAHVGQRGMGALSYEPDLGESDRAPVVLELDAIARDAATVLKGEEGAVIEKLLKLNGASAGARPKVVTQVSADRKRIIHRPATLPDGYAHWMIKFPSAQDDTAAGATSTPTASWRAQQASPCRRPISSRPRRSGISGSSGLTVMATAVSTCTASPDCCTPITACRPSTTTPF